MTLLLYTVQAADAGAGLSDLAYRFYGDAARWPELYQLNRAIVGSDPALLRVGQQIIIRVGTVAVPSALRGPAGARYRRAVPPSDALDAGLTLLLYSVQPEDIHASLPGLARRLYGDATRWPELYKVNQAIIGIKPSHLEVGQQVIVPVRLDDGDQLAVRVYTVQRNDHIEGLLGLARRLYGDTDRWATIYAVNHGTIGATPLHISPGQQLIIVD